MKTKYLLLGIGALVTLSGLWFGRAVWRAQRQVVTLDVREVPLPDVLRKIERLTWTKIRAEQSLADVRATLHVRDKPLRTVLDRLAEQAGARWVTLHAVYNSTRALETLESVLNGDGKLEEAGWTRIAPNLPVANPSELEASNTAPAPNSGPTGARRQMMFLRQGNAVVLQGADGRMETWSPEELVMESALKPRLGSGSIQTATIQTAADIAARVHGHWTTLLAFRKSEMGVGLRMPPPCLGPGQVMRGPNPNDRFVTLTPAQRVRREQARLGFDSQ